MPLRSDPSYGSMRHSSSKNLLTGACMRWEDVVQLLTTMLGDGGPMLSSFPVENGDRVLE